MRCVEWIRLECLAVPVLVFDGAVPPAKGSEKEQRLARCADAFEEVCKSNEDKVRDKFFDLLCLWLGTWCNNGHVTLR